MAEDSMFKNIPIKDDDVQEDAKDKQETVNEEEHQNKEVLENIETKNETEESLDKPEAETEVQQEEEVDTLWQSVSERLGRDVKGEDDLFITKEVEVEVEKPLEYASEESKAIDKYIKETGRSIKDFSALNRDLDSLTTEEIIKENLKVNNPTLTSDEIDFKYTDEFTVDEELMDDTERRRMEIKIKTESHKGLTRLKSEKDTYLQPLEDSKASIASQQEEQQRAWQDLVTKSSSELNGIDITLDEDVKFTHNISDEHNKVVKDIASDNSMTKWADMFRQEDGNLNVNDIQKSIYLWLNKEAIFKEIASQSKAHTTEDIVKQKRNIDFKSDTKPEAKPTVSEGRKNVNSLWSKMGYKL